jgi:hypothetical protein
MFSNSHNSRGSSTKARKAVSRWRVFCMAVVLALWVGSAGQPFSAKAAPAATEFRFKLNAKKDKGNATVCVGDKVPISAQVTRLDYVGNKVINRRIVPIRQIVPGILIVASMSNAIGNLSPFARETGWSPMKPGTANFTLTAEKAGTTTITFTGEIYQAWWMSKLGVPAQPFRTDVVKDQLTIKVEDCEYKVNTYSEWVQNGGYFTVIAKINEAGMKRDVEGGPYTGIASVDWNIIPNLDLSGCTMAAMVVPPSVALLYGEIEGDNLHVEVSFDSVNFEPVAIACPILPGSPEGTAQSDSKRQAEQLIFTIPGRSGGAGGMPQDFTGFPSGSAYFVVKRVTGQ